MFLKYIYKLYTEWQRRRRGEELLCVMVGNRQHGFCRHVTDSSNFGCYICHHVGIAMLGYTLVFWWQK